METEHCFVCASQLLIPTEMRSGVRRLMALLSSPKTSARRTVECRSGASRETEDPSGRSVSRLVEACLLSF